MEDKQVKKMPNKLWFIVVSIVVVVGVILCVLLLLRDGGDEAPEQTQPSQTQATEDIGQTQAIGQTLATEGTGQWPEETTGISLDTKHIELHYPAELEDQVTVTYEDLKDGQQIIFTTDFTGEALELFRFSISSSGTGGYHLGTLVDEQVGDLLVHMHIQDYTNTDLAADVYAKLNSMQERVNDIIIQFHEDARFVPNR